MKKIVIYGGTVEGRELTEFLANNEIDVSVCVATKYGGAILPNKENVHVYVERMDKERMSEFLGQLKPDCCIDATHPYAELVTKNIYAACEECEIRYIRVKRERTSAVYDESNLCDGDIIYMENIENAVCFLENTDGNIFITTGSKELEKYTAIGDYKNRCIARVLPTAEVMNKCDELGFCGKNLVCMQGPFSEEMNYQMYKMTDARWLVTKNTGFAGGFTEKCEAAIRAGMRIVIIGRPVENVGASYTLEQVKNMFVGAKENKKIYLIGMGPGNSELITNEALSAIRKSDVLIGADRVLKIYEDYEKKKHLISYKVDEIKKYITEHPENKNIALLYSGDIGFYSGAAAFTESELKTELKELGYEICTIAGISSPIYMLDKLGIAWQDVCIVSNHGTQTSLIPLIRDNRYVCSLLGDKTTVSDTCMRLAEYGMKDIRVTVGERLSYGNEHIISKNALEMAGRELDALSVVLFENNNVRRYHAPGIPDDEFVRGNVPMTKQEVRTVSISKLMLDSHSIVYDVGAGTGSISVEASIIASQGEVYAIEKNENAIELIKDNKRKFAADNIRPVAGMAPCVLESLPTPTHAFIGGSSGNILEIIEAIRGKNINTRFVVNAVTMETLMELMKIMELYPEYKDMELIQVGVSKSRVMGDYHLMTAENAVYIASFGGGYI